MINTSVMVPALQEGDTQVNSFNPSGSPTMASSAPAGTTSGGYGFWDYVGNLFTGDIDYERNVGMAEMAHERSVELMEQQNAFTAEREDLAWSRYMDAVKADRAWQEQMANTQVQRQVEDLKKAGINPMMAARLNGASTGTGGVSGYSSASSASAQAPNYPAYKLRENMANAIGNIVKSVIAAAIGGKMLFR